MTVSKIPDIELRYFAVLYDIRRWGASRSKPLQIPGEREILAITAESALERFWLGWTSKRKPVNVRVIGLLKRFDLAAEQQAQQEFIEREKAYWAAEAEREKSGKPWPWN